VKTKWTRLVPLTVCLAAFYVYTPAQGGWRQWDIVFRDGTRIEANPLGMNHAGHFTRGMGKEPGFERSKISYIAAGRRELPPLPGGTTGKDRVVMLDGSVTTGAVTFRKLEFSEGTIVQNGKEMTLENVAFIIFAIPKKKLPQTRRKT
jgi:hypothetical protein